MGFIPIILTLSAAIMLFIMAVHHSIKTKKSRMDELQSQMTTGIMELVKDTQIPSGDLSETFQLAKKNIKSGQEDEFHLRVRIPYQRIKLIRAEYNQLIAKKPYSFVAKIMNHKPI